MKEYQKAVRRKPTASRGRGAAQAEDDGAEDEASESWVPPPKVSEGRWAGAEAGPSMLARVGATRTTPVVSDEGAAEVKMEISGTRYGGLRGINNVDDVVDLIAECTDWEVDGSGTVNLEDFNIVYPGSNRCFYLI